MGPNRFAGAPSTISDVAAAAGVSVTTVSHTLSRRRSVSPETEQRVMDAVAALGYRPNQLARSLRTQQTMTVALVIPDITNPFYPEVARGVQDLLAASGYQLFICNTDGGTESERSFLSDAISRRVDGVILVPSGPSGGESIAALTGAEIPVVQLAADLDSSDRGAGQLLTDYVHSDDRRGTAAATNHLLATGHTRIAYVGGPTETGPAGRRLTGYLEALEDAGVGVDRSLITAGPFSRVGGVVGLQVVLDAGAAPTAVVCANDLIAIGALDVAQLRGLRVPDDLAIIGFDDIEAASLVSPPLTTVLNPAREIGHACGRLLLDRMSGSYTSAPRELLVATALIRRASA
jgi:LacI family transcriptional regulator